MGLLIEITKFIVYCTVIVLISKYVLVTNIRKLGENLKLKPSTVGNIAGYATSVPELLTVAISSFNGLLGAGLYNVLSSNIINFLQYIITIFINKNQRRLSNSAIKTNIFLVITTILIPLFLISFKIKMGIWTTVVFIILYIIYIYINKNVHKVYIPKNINHKEKSNSISGNLKYILFLILSGIMLFFAGELLGVTLENLCYRYKVPQIIIGILLGFITSIPELITFIESQKHYKKDKDDLYGVVEATNNLFTSNILNLFIIQSVGVLIYVVFA